jgi:hypothetical protein
MESKQISLTEGWDLEGARVQQNVGGRGLGGLLFIHYPKEVMS